MNWIEREKRLERLGDTVGCEGDIFDLLDDFSEELEELDLRPWGWKGKTFLNLALRRWREANRDNCDWIVCGSCHREFIPRMNEDLVKRYLLYRREEIEHDELYTCKKCGEIECEKILKEDEKSAHFPEEKVL